MRFLNKNVLTIYHLGVFRMLITFSAFGGIFLRLEITFRVYGFYGLKVVYGLFFLILEK